jgi:uncharacterized repeat protein (TIGR04076 family)
MKIRITVLESRCRDRLCKAGDTYLVDQLCPPVCHELWGVIYPQIFALQNGAKLDHGDERVTFFEASCPDGGRVRIRAEAIE